MISEENTFLYDGSFYGLMSTIYTLTKKRIMPIAIVAEKEYQENLFESGIYIKTEQADAQKVIDAVKRDLAPTSYRHVLYTFLSDTPEAPLTIYQYLLFGWKARHDIDNYITEDAVAKVHSLSAKVSKEAHRMLQFVRFAETQNKLFYSAIETDHNVLPIIAPYFAERNATVQWIIHDTTRNSAILFKDEEWQIVDFTLNKAIPYHKDEQEYQEMWCSYFKTIAIKERKNLKLQRQFAPKRYWKHLVEQLGGE